ncbi:unnamed protein product [Phytomonas sp. Hart1]|nr:unnamed protein product [Phytomonas sp. Hart1]|eukprot:CCW72226.1 unnamed protein product [Phytomonas sp. isolate Hart1]
MYAIKPWGNVFAIGSTIESYTMGIGMRWRESNVTIVEKRPTPSYELHKVHRCVLTEQTLKLLIDLGCTENKLRAILKPALGWRFINSQMEVLKESTTFPGCAIGEASFHCSKGLLMRLLRTEFLRFGGTVIWGSEAYDAFESHDGTDTWCLRKDYGLGTAVEAIITTSKRTALHSALIAHDPDRITVLFDVDTGVSHIDRKTSQRIFGANHDVSIMVGQGLAMHVWLMDECRCSWRLVRTARKKIEGEADVLETLTTDLRNLIFASENRMQHICALPGTTPAIRDDKAHAKISVLGDGLLPIDPFEWRGDNARCAIEEASAVCRLFYGKKYHRGDTSFLLRSIEQDSISKRANLLKRDLVDAEHFLALHPALHDEPVGPIGLVGAN